MHAPLHAQKAPLYLAKAQANNQSIEQELRAPFQSASISTLRILGSQRRVSGWCDRTVASTHFSGAFAVKLRQGDISCVGLGPHQHLPLPIWIAAKILPRLTCRHRWAWKNMGNLFQRHGLKQLFLLGLTQEDSFLP